MRIIKLTQGQSTVIDDEDYEKFGGYKWYAYYNPHTKSFYAVRAVYNKLTGKQKTISLHREILACPSDIQIDHISHDTLDNRKKNLRIVTHRQNHHNLKRKTTSIYPGVSWYKRDKKWQATIRIDGKSVHLGYFTDELEAFQAYCRALEVINETLYNPNKIFSG